MGRLTRKESQDITRARLRQAARVEFAKAGISGASVDRICAAAAYSRPAFYANFRAKRDLALDVLGEICAEETQAWAEMIQTTPDLPTLIFALEQRFEAFVQNRESRLLSAELRLEAERDEAFGAAYQAMFKPIILMVSENLRGLARAMGREGEVDTHYAAIALYALSHGLALGRAGLLDGWSAGEILTKCLFSMLSGTA